MEELKPCPFCGGRAIIVFSFGKPHVEAFHTKKCLIEPDSFLVSHKTSIKKQVKAWNRRAE